MPAITSDRTRAAMLMLDNFYAQKGSEASVSQSKITPKGGTQDTFESFAWVPATLRDMNALPENLRTFGSPWVLRTVKGSYRFGADHIPFFGSGMFLLGIKGSAWVVSWDIAAVSDLAIPFEDSFSEMGQWVPKQLSGFLDSSAFHATLQENEAIWIPFGHVFVLSALLSDPVTYTLQIPFMSPVLAKQAEPASMGSVYNALATWMDRVGEVRPWSVIGKPFLSWLRAQIAGQDEGHLSQASQEPLDGQSGAAGSASVSEKHISPSKSAAGIPDLN